MLSNVNIMMLIVTAELIVIESMLCAGLERRKWFVVSMMGCVLPMILYALFFPLVSMGVFIQVPIVLLSFAHIFLCYEVNVPQALFIGVAGYTIEHIASLLNSIITLAAPEQFKHFGEDIQVGIPAYILIVICTAVTYTGAWYLLIRRMRGMRLLKNATVPIVLLSTVMLVMNQIWGLSFELYGAEYAGSLLSFFEYIWNLTCCVFCLCIQFGIFQISQKEQALEIARRLIAEKEQQYRISKSTIEAVNRKCHNLKYELSALTAGPDGQKHIDEAMSLVDSFDSAFRTGNETLDVVLSEKNQYCQQAQITFVCMVDGEKLDFMDVTDQYVLFGNIIDNAINAVQKLAEPEKRVIYINMHTQKRLLLIQTENSFAGSLQFHHGLPVTTSGDEENHGYGMPSVRMICEKYGGAVNTKAENGIFYLNILIPLP